MAALSSVLVLSRPSGREGAAAQGARSSSSVSLQAGFKLSVLSGSRFKENQEGEKAGLG